MKKKIKPISSEQFYDSFAVKNNKQGKNYYDYFATTIEDIKSFAIGPFFWLIVDNIQLKFVNVSENIEQLTPFSKAEWLNSIDCYVQLFHPDDRHYVLSAAAFAAEMTMTMRAQTENLIKFNIFHRKMNKEGNYHWALLQSPKQYINEENQMEAILIVFYDLSHFQIKNMPLLSIIDYRNKEIQYFKHFDQEIKKIDQLVPKITKREKEILLLMSQGFNTPAIADRLFISQHTVENHKRNLRQKTQSKTASQLIAYTMTHSLLLLE